MEYLDNKLPENWNTIPTRKLVIWAIHRIFKRLDKLESSTATSPSAITDVDMNKIKRPEVIQ